MVGSGSIVMVAEGSEEHPTLLLKVNVTSPGAIPVTTPPLVITAIFSLLLCHTPPVPGVKVVLSPMQIVDGPVISIDVGSSTVRTSLAPDEHPVVLLEYIN